MRPWFSNGHGNAKLTELMKRLNENVDTAPARGLIRQRLGGRTGEARSMPFMISQQECLQDRAAGLRLSLADTGLGIQQLTTPLPGR